MGTTPDEDAAFRALYERTAPALLAYLRRVTGSPDRAEDLLQDVYVRWLNADRPEMDERETRAYLYRVATNLVYDRWRAMRREREWAEASPAPAPADPEPVGLRRDVAAALERLSPRERALVWLAHVEGYSHREIGPMVEVRPESVRVLLFRARRKLAQILEEAGWTPD